MARRRDEHVIGTVGECRVPDAAEHGLGVRQRLSLIHHLQSPYLL